MSGSITIKLSLFGAFRAFNPAPELELILPAGANLVQLRQAIKSELGKNPAFNQVALVDESALADEQEILAEDALFTRDAALAILPPVCGG